MAPEEKPMPEPVANASQRRVTEERSFSHKQDGSYEMSITKDSSQRIRTLEQLLAFFEVDPLEWEVKDWGCRKWEMGSMPRAVGSNENWRRENTNPIVTELYSVYAKFRRRDSMIAAVNEIEALRKKATKYAPKYGKPVLPKKSRSPSGNLVELSPVDHHFGALIWGKETGDRDWDLSIAVNEWKRSARTLIDRTAFWSPDEVVVVLGNDQQNADNRAGTTEHGTRQDMDSRYQKVFAASRDCSIWLVEQLMTVAKVVSVVIVPGNHDPLSAWHLGDSLYGWFHNCKNVTVDNAPSQRKYRQHGINMLMWTHGNTGKLDLYPDTMAAEQPAMWGATKWREAHTADKHHRRLLELKGATVRILPSLRPPCAWSAENHFIGSVPAAEAYVWNAREGLIATATYSPIGEPHG